VDERKRQQRQEKFARLDAWLQWLQKQHPFLALLLTAGIALLVFGLAMLLKWLVESAANG
jgi:hypothetical protein